MAIIQPNCSIIPACDIPFDRFKLLVKETADISQVGAYKIGAALALSVGLRAIVEQVRSVCEKPIIYDHQKAGTDIPDTAYFFMETLKDAGVDAVILFPLAGSHTQSTWTAAARAAGLGVIVGGHMTHKAFLSSQGGYVADEAVTRIYEHAAADGVADFVVPGNKPDVISAVRSLLLTSGIDPTFYAPGFLAQGGSISDAAQAAGSHWHAIVGRALFDDPQGFRSAALGLAKNL